MNFLYRKFIKNYQNTKDSKVIKRYGLLAGVLGTIFNVILSITKVVIGLLSGSVSIISDAFNNLSDASSSIITIIGFKMSSKPADKRHPFGHQRIEYICAFIISAIILFVGVELGVSSFKKILNPGIIEFNYLMLIVLSITVIIKLWMSLFYYKTSKKINSLSLKASARDSLNDVIATSIVIVGLLIGKLFNLNIDGYLGLIVCIYIVISGIVLIKETVDKLIGGTPDTELIEKIKKDIMNERQILGIHDVLYHYYGNNQVYMTLHVEVDSALPLKEAHDIIDNIEKKVKKIYTVELVIHVDPILLNDELLSKVNNELQKIIKRIDKQLSFHELSIYEKNNKKIISFDLQVPYDFKITNEELYNTINKELKLIDQCYRASITFDKV